MIAAGWGAVFVFLFCMFSLGLMPEGNDSARWAILVLAVVAFLVGFFAFGGHRQDRAGGDGIVSDPKRSPSPPIHRPVSPYFDRGRGAR